MKSEFIPKDEELEVEDVTVNEQVYKKRSTFEKVLGKIDIFSNNNQLTFEGKRSVQSICGGVTCILFLILTILLTQYFLTVYFDESEYSVSYETIYDNKNEASDL